MHHQARGLVNSCFCTWKHTQGGYLGDRPPSGVRLREQTRNVRKITGVAFTPNTPVMCEQLLGTAIRFLLPAGFASACSQWEASAPPQDVGGKTWKFSPLFHLECKKEGMCNGTNPVCSIIRKTHQYQITRMLLSHHHLKDRQSKQKRR